jgi:hypothetical protein
LTVFLEAQIDVRPLTARHLDLFVEMYSSAEAPELDRHGFELVGAWKRTGGSLNHVVHLYRFDSLERYVAIRAAVRADERFAAVVDAYHASPLQLSEVTTLCTATRWSDEEHLGKALVGPLAARQYVHVTLQVRSNGASTAHALLTNSIRDAEAAGGFQLVAAYEPVVGLRDRLTVVGNQPNRPHNIE